MYLFALAMMDPFPRRFGAWQKSRREETLSRAFRFSAPRHVGPLHYPARMQSEQRRQRRRERKRLERERNKKESRKAQMCAGDELDFLLTRRVASLFGR